jgi:hypothetical protein
VSDHPSLAEAASIATEIVPLFVLDPALLGASANRDRFLLECLADLEARSGASAAGSSSVAGLSSSGRSRSRPSPGARRSS